MTKKTCEYIFAVKTVEYNFETDHQTTAVNENNHCNIKLFLNWSFLTLFPTLLHYPVSLRSAMEGQNTAELAVIMTGKKIRDFLL